METTTDPTAFPTAAVLAMSQGIRFPETLDVRVGHDLAARLAMMGAAGLDIGEVLSDAAREGVRQSFDAWVATLPAEGQVRARVRARRGDEDAAAAIALRLRMLEDARRNEAERRRLDALRLEQEKAKVPTPEERVMAAALPWLEQTAATGWVGDFVAFHRNAVVESLGGRPMGWPFRRLACDGPFLSAVRSAMGVGDDATLGPDDLATVRRLVGEAKAARAKALGTGPRGASVSTASIGRGR